MLATPETLAIMRARMGEQMYIVHFQKPGEADAILGAEVAGAYKPQPEAYLRTAEILGIPFYVWDLSERFHEDVVEDFLDEYAAGSSGPEDWPER